MTSAEVGTNSHPQAAAAATMEALYTACCDEAFHIEPAEEYEIDFQTDPAGLMKVCSAQLKNCYGGCDEGPYGAGLFLQELVFGAPSPAP